MELNKKSAVIATSSVTIAAAVEHVWQLMVNINQWPEWNSDVEFASLNGPLAVGTVFSWKVGQGTIVSTLETVEPKERIAWSGKLMGIRAVHIWELKLDNESTIVTTYESWDGLLARLFKRYSQETLQKAIVRGLQLLKDAAERSETTSSFEKVI